VTYISITDAALATAAVFQYMHN